MPNTLPKSDYFKTSGAALARALLISLTLSFLLLQRL